MNTHTMVSDLHRGATGQDGIDNQHHSVSSSSYPPTTERSPPPQTQVRSATSSNTMGSTGSLLHSVPPGEVPPPPPRACFGRDELIDKIVDLAENLTPTALIGPGGIGKTSVALTVLHHDRIKQRFGHNCRFIRCDKFPPSSTHFLSRVSKVIGAGVENPEDLTPLRPFLSSGEMVIILDNAESILDPQGTNAREIYAIVEELSQFNNICLCITTRISTIPSDCEILEIPTLPKEAALNAFYRIYKNDEPSDLVDKVLEELDFHPLSVTLLATVAHNNRWDNDQLTREWEQQRTGVLQTEHNKSLAATIERSLASPMFRGLGPDARGLLEVAAFFPQGINENSIDWLFPAKNIFSRLFSTAPKRKDIINKFCLLSLTYRSGGFITMLAPLRDYFRPKDPMSSPPLRKAKKCYFSRLSVCIEPDEPNFEAARWITSEDVNIEHLLDVFTTIDPNSSEVWRVCRHFMQYLHWHKPRLVMLGPKIEGLLDTHRSKPKCLYELSWLFGSVGNRMEHKRLLIHTLKLWRERGNERWIALTLRSLSDTNRLLGLHEEGIQQMKESLEILERLKDKLGQAESWRRLARLLYDDGQLDAAEEAVSRALNLAPHKDHPLLVCQSHRLLGNIYSSKGETEKAINYFETALGTASTFNWPDEHFWIHCSLAKLFFGKNEFSDAHAHIEHAKSHVVNSPYNLARAMQLQAQVWCEERRFEEAKSEALRALDIYEKFGAMNDVEVCRAVLRDIEEKANTPGALDTNGEPPKMTQLPIPVNSLFLARTAE